MAKRAASKAVEKQTEIALNTATSALGVAIVEFLKHL